MITVNLRSFKKIRNVDKLEKASHYLILVHKGYLMKRCKKHLRLLKKKKMREVSNNFHDRNRCT